MKNMIFVLAMLLTAATAFTQTSRKPANNNTAKEPKENTTTRSRANTGNQRDTYDANSRRSAGTVNTTTQTNQQPSTRENTRENSSEAKPVSRENNNVQRNENANHERHNNGVRSGNYQNQAYHNDRESVNRDGSHSRNVVEYESPRVYRNNHRVVHQYHNPPATREYRSVHYVYRRPLHYEVYWTPAIHQHFVEIYPMVPTWHYRHGNRIEMISAYDAMYYRGEVMTVYGEVFEVFYERQTDEFFLYFGAYYPYQDFTVIIPGYLARKYSHRPERFFENQSLAVTGLITTFNGEPEIVVKRSFQLSLY